MNQNSVEVGSPGGSGETENQNFVDTEKLSDKFKDTENRLEMEDENGSSTPTFKYDWQNVADEAKQQDKRINRGDSTAVKTESLQIDDIDDVFGLANKIHKPTDDIVQKFGENEEFDGNEKSDENEKFEDQEIFMDDENPKNVKATENETKYSIDLSQKLDERNKVIADLKKQLEDKETHITDLTLENAKLDFKVKLLLRNAKLEDRKRIEKLDLI